MGCRELVGKGLSQSRQQSRRTEKGHTVLNHPLAREVHGVVGEQDVGLGAERDREDVAVLHFHLDHSTRTARGSRTWVDSEPRRPTVVPG